MSFPHSPAGPPQTPQLGGYYVRSAGGLHGHGSPFPTEPTRYHLPGIGDSPHLPLAPLSSADLRGMSGAEAHGAPTWPSGGRGVPVVLRPSHAEISEYPPAHGNGPRLPQQPQVEFLSGVRAEKDKVGRPAWRVLDADGDLIGNLPEGVDWKAEGRLVVDGAQEPRGVWVARSALVAAGTNAACAFASAAWYNAAADFAVARAALENARAGGSSPPEELSRLEAEVERAKAEAKIAELEARDPKGSNETVQGQIKELRRAVAADKDAAAERERRLAASAASSLPSSLAAQVPARARAWLVEATVTGRTGQPRLRAHILAQRCGGYYAVARKKGDEHRAESIFWEGPAPSEGSSAAASLEYGSARVEDTADITRGDNYTLAVRVAFSEVRLANDFVVALLQWPRDDAGVEVVVEEPRQLEGAFDEINTHEFVRREHYVHGADSNTPPTTPPKDVDRTFSYHTDQTLCKPLSPLGKFQGIDVKRGFRHKCSGEAAHLIDRRVVGSVPKGHPYEKLKFFKLDDDHATSSCNFVGVSAQLHKLIDGHDASQASPPVALKFHSQSSDPIIVGGGDDELAEHDRFAVELDVIFRDNDRDAYIEDGSLAFDDVVEHTTVSVGGVERSAVRVRLFVRDPTVFRYCVDWKFLKTMRGWVEVLDEADDVPSFGIDASVYPDHTINSQFVQQHLYTTIQTRAMRALGL